MTAPEKPLIWVKAEVKTPPFSTEARKETGFLLRLLQHGQTVGMPHSKKMSDLCPHCHELRIKDQGRQYRIIYRVDSDAILILHAFEKKSGRIPQRILETCRKRMSLYDEAIKRE